MTLIDLLLIVLTCGLKFFNSVVVFVDEVHDYDGDGPGESQHKEEVKSEFPTSTSEQTFPFLVNILQTSSFWSLY
jgi:hypothetical protein